MRYQIQITVGPGALPTVIEAACKDNPEPDLRVMPVVNAKESLPPRTPPWWTQPAKKQRKLSPDGIKRQEVLGRALKTGPKRWGELRKALTESGLSEGTLNSLITKWKNEGKIMRGDEGFWSLVG